MQALAAGWARAGRLGGGAGAAGECDGHCRRLHQPGQSDLGSRGRRIQYFYFPPYRRCGRSRIPGGETANLYYDDLGAIAGVYYYYWIKSGDGLTNSAFSAGAVGCAGWRRPQPDGGTGTLFNAVALAWVPATYAVKYQVWRHAPDQ